MHHNVSKVFSKSAIEARSFINVTAQLIWPINQLCNLSRAPKNYVLSVAVSPIKCVKYSLSTWSTMNRYSPSKNHPKYEWCLESNQRSTTANQYSIAVRSEKSENPSTKHSGVMRRPLSNHWESRVFANLKNRTHKHALLSNRTRGLPKQKRSKLLHRGNSWIISRRGIGWLHRLSLLYRRITLIRTR
jgi:hypothetical protein